MEIAHEIIYSRSHPLHWFKKAVVSYLQKYEHKVLLTNKWTKPAQEKCERLTNRLDMNLTVTGP